MNPETPADLPVGVLLSRDLIFTTKITGTAREQGRIVLVAGRPDQAATLIAERKPRVVFVDLTAGDLASTPTLVALRQMAGPDTPFVAFGPHVDTPAFAAASAAGCDPVMPRSKFTVQLPDLILRYLGPGR